MMDVYEAIAVGLAWGLAIASFFSYLAARRALRSTEEICSRHRNSMDTIFADVTEGIRVNSQDAIEQIKQHGEETRERIDRYAEETSKEMR